MPDAFVIFPVLYLAAVFAVVAVVVVAFWRLMKAQEATARALDRIAHALSGRTGPPA